MTGVHSGTTSGQTSDEEQRALDLGPDAHFELLDLLIKLATLVIPQGHLFAWPKS